MGLVARYATALLGSVALGVLSAGAAHAQAQNPNTKYVTLLERLVIGTGAPKVAIDTPQAVTVVDQADIDAKQASTTGEILKDVPGVTLIGSDRVLGESYNIRGIGEAETSGDEARIIITVDGAKKFYEQYRMGSFFSDPELYKRVEVLRGPASSTLYGSGAFGGVINFTTKDASDFIQDGQNGAARVKGSYSSNGNGTLASGILAHRINETFEILATGNFRRSDVQRLASGNPMTGSDFAAWSGLVKGTMYIDDEQTLRLSYQKWNSAGNDQPYSQTDPQNFGTVDRTVDDQTAVLSYENPASDDPMLDLKVQLSYSDTDVKQSDNAFFGPTGNANYGYKTVQLNVQNTSELSGDNWVNYVTYGIQASHQNRIGKPNVGGIITTHPEGTSTNFGLFAQTEHTIDDKLTLIAGARGDYSYIAPSAALTPVNAPFGQFTFSPKVAALYKFNENFNVFGSVAHTERIPTLDERFQYSGVNRPASPNLKKELSDNFELGFATQGFDALTDGDSVGFKATAFYNNITDGVRVNPDQSGGKPYFTNIPGMRIYGIELEGSYESEVAFARLAYTFTRGEYTQAFNGLGSGGAPAPSRTRNAGDPVDSLPQDKIVLTLGGRLPEHNFEYGAKITAAATPVVQVAMPIASTAWATVDVFANWKPQDGPLAGTEAQFAIENLFDTDYRENLSQDRSRGRTFKLTLAKQFDY